MSLVNYTVFPIVIYPTRGGIVAVANNPWLIGCMTILARSTRRSVGSWWNRVIAVRRCSCWNTDIVFSCGNIPCLHAIYCEWTTADNSARHRALRGIFWGRGWKVFGSETGVTVYERFFVVLRGCYLFVTGMTKCRHQLEVIVTIRTIIGSDTKIQYSVF